MGVAIALRSPRATSRAIALRALEIVESLDGANIPLHQAALGSVWLAERYLESGGKSYGGCGPRARRALARVLEEIPYGVLGGDCSRFAQVRNLGGGAAAEIRLLLGMCDAGVVRAEPSAVAALCVEAEEKTAGALGGSPWGRALAARALARAWDVPDEVRRRFRG